MKNKGIIVRKTDDKIELLAPHRNGQISFLFPHLCWMNSGKTFVQTKESIRKQRLIFPTLAETASIVYAAWHNPNEEYSKQVIRAIEYESVWTNNGLLAVPNKGMYVQDSPRVMWWKHFNESELIKKLEARDKNVRFAPFEEESFELNAKDLAKSKLLIALAGKEGAEKLSYVAAKYGDNGHCFGVRVHTLPYSMAQYERDNRKIDSQVIHLCVRGGLKIAGSDINFIPDYNYSFAIIKK